jgi:hypothetical protein
MGKAGGPILIPTPMPTCADAVAGVTANATPKTSNISNSEPMKRKDRILITSQCYFRVCGGNCVIPRQSRIYRECSLSMSNSPEKAKQITIVGPFQASEYDDSHTRSIHCFQYDLSLY